MLTNIRRILEESVPADVRSKFQMMLDYAGESERADSWFVRNLTFSLAFAFGVMILPIVFEEFFENFTIGNLYLFMFILFLSSAFLFWIIVYSSISFKIEYRKVRTFDILPDFLSSVAMNIHAGMEPISALYVSLRADFEPITSEMKKTRSLAIGSKSILEQLSYLTTKIDSEPLRRTISILDRASKSGGELGRLLLSVADDLRETSKVQKELEAATKGYVYFISFLILFGVPLLLSVSFVFIQTTSEQTKNFSGGLASLGGLSTGIPLTTGGGAGAIDPQSVFIIFLILLSVSAVSASLMLGILWHGEAKQGLRYTAILLPATLIAFTVFKMFIGDLISAFGI